MSHRLSKRTSWELNESSYAAAVREIRASGKTVYDLSRSNPTQCDFLYDADATLMPLLDIRALSYDPDPRGVRSAREAVATYYAEHRAVVDPDSLVLTPSTSEAYSFLFRLLCDAGDEVLVAQPSYPLFDFIAGLDDVRLKTYPLFYDSGWWIDFAALERNITSRTKAILVVHPNNPTGHWTAASERSALEALCARHDLALIVDEVFLDYPLDASGVPCTFATGPHPVLTFVLSGMSKIAGLPQMKAAWVLTLGPLALRLAALARLEIIADTFLSMNAPVQLALPSWLRNKALLQGQILARAQTNLATLIQLQRKVPGGVQLLACQAGWSAVLGLPACVGELSCAERLVREQGVIVHPGYFYGMTEAHRVVVSLIGPAVEFVQGISLAVAQQ